MESYAYARTGYHRGLDAPCRSGWATVRSPGRRALHASTPCRRFLRAAAHFVRAAVTVTASARRTPRRCCPEGTASNAPSRPSR
ncbi:DUF3151 family protein [Streptomyces sp. NPDC087787]|uniref:DUF3151 family protein n=1 Tax=Streptomyces sp. NPDC087787 TaxID=3365803 RepID=UPI00381EE610